MYSDKPIRKKAWILWVLLLLAAAVILVWAAGNPGQNLSDNGAAAIREAVRRSALQCYAVEGVYPPDLQYLEENYGLQINHEDFYVAYDAFASNLPPTVRVTRR